MTTPPPFNHHNYPHSQQQKSYVMQTTPTPAFRPLSNRYQPPPPNQRHQVSNYHAAQQRPPSFYESDNTDDPELLQMTYPNPPNSTYRSFNKYQPNPDKTRYDPNVLTNNTTNSRSLPGSKRYYSSNKSKHSNRERDRDRDRPRPLQADNERYYDHIFPTYKTARSDVTAGDGAASMKRHQGGRNSYNSVYYQPESYRDHAEL